MSGDERVPDGMGWSDQVQTLGPLAGPGTVKPRVDVAADLKAEDDDDDLPYQDVYYYDEQKGGDPELT
jgi:hypothetical protein